MSASLNAAAPYVNAAAPYAAALVLTLVLAARCTPRSWWRRPNLRALAVTGGGTLLIGFLLTPLLAPLFGALFAAPAPGPAAPVPLAAVLPPSPPAPDAAAPARGASYLVVADLNLRMETGTGAPRMTVLRAGSRVTASGARRGDWWQVRSQAGGREREGWASSLWLRRIDEAGRPER